jgi:hypothetical protein
MGPERHVKLFKNGRNQAVSTQRKSTQAPWRSHSAEFRTVAAIAAPGI